MNLTEYFGTFQHLRMIKQESILCKRCNRLFVCNPDHIADCECSKIKLRTNAIEYISKKYQSCLCNLCLMQLNEEYYHEYPDRVKDS